MEDLHYDGPLTLIPDHEEDTAADPDEPAHPGRVFITASLAGALILTLFAVAIWLRQSTSDAVGGKPPVARLEGTAGPERTDVPRSAANAAAAPETAPGVDPSANAAPPTSTTTQAFGHRALPQQPEVLEPAAAPVASASERQSPRPSGEIGAAAPEPLGASQGAVAEVTREPAAPAPPRPRPAPTPAAQRADAPASPVLAAALRAGERALSAAPRGSYTLQVLAACQPDTVTKAFAAVGQQALHVLPASLHGQDCYRLVWGSYSTRAAALAAQGEVPEYFRSPGKPQPVAIDTLLGR